MPRAYLRVNTMNKWYLSILLWVHLTSHAAGAAAEKFIFYQPWLSHQQVSAATWNEMGQDLRAQGYTHVIFQWSQYGQNQFWGADKSSLLQRVVQTPGPKAIQYIFGLYLGEDYYAKLGQSDQALSQYLAQSRQFALQNARKIMQQSPRAVAGWYLPEEIDDLNWRTPARQKLLQAHFLALSKELKAIAPNTQIYASAFFGGHTPPADFAKQMNTLLRTTGMILLV